jgi:hypothetical protein
LKFFFFVVLGNVVEGETRLLLDNLGRHASPGWAIMAAFITHTFPWQHAMALRGSSNIAVARDDKAAILLTLAQRLFQNAHLITMC